MRNELIWTALWKQGLQSCKVGETVGFGNIFSSPSQDSRTYLSVNTEAVVVVSTCTLFDDQGNMLI